MRYIECAQCGYAQPVVELFHVREQRFQCDFCGKRYPDVLFDGEEGVLEDSAHTHTFDICSECMRSAKKRAGYWVKEALS